MKPSASSSTAAPPPDSIIRNTSLAFAVKLAGAIFTAGLTLFLVRVLGPEHYGIYSLAVGIAAIAVMIADFGISAAAARFVAEHRRNPVAIGGVLIDALKLKVGASALIAVLMFALAGPIADGYGTPALLWPLRAVSVAVFAQSLMLLFTAAFEALWRVALSLRVVLTESAVETSTSVTLVLLGGGATGAICGRALGYLAAVVFAAPVLLKVIGRPTRPRARSAENAGWREIAGYAAALAVIDGALTLFTRVDVLLIGGYLGAAAVGRFEAPLALMSFLENGGQAVAGGVAPRIARTPGHEPNVAAFTSGLRYLILAQAIVLAPLVVWATPLVDLAFGPDYGESVEVIRALAPFALLVGVAPLLGRGVNYIGEARRRVPAAIAAVLINLVIDVVLIPRIGIVGGAIGTDVAYVVYVAVHLRICQEFIGMKILPILIATGRALLAAVAMAAVLLAIGTENLSAADWILGAVGGTVAYVFTLIVIGGVSLQELTALQRGIAARLPRRT